MVVGGEINQLGYIHKTLAATKASATVIVDFIHVLEYLWKAAYGFHAVSSQEAEQWVTERALKYYKAKAQKSPRACAEAPHQNLSQEKRKAVDKCAGYLRNNKPYLKYDEYLLPAPQLPVA